ncbi:hypothetical protein UPYG_G00104710 [Umbra pygmaea]|uniref:Ig-like domain-containing protein n=1 Tax=Umbra pygmaea TaxID=75934 RepID=A0ABD0X1L4_UMBPY
MTGIQLLLILLGLFRVQGQSMESIPSSPIVKKPGETLSLSCKGSGFDFGQSGMHWIRQPAGRDLVWMGVIWYDASKTIYAKSVEGRIEITRDNSNSMVYLKLSGLRTEDSAVYYCARNTVMWISGEAVQKPIRKVDPTEGSKGAVQQSIIQIPQDPKPPVKHQLNKTTVNNNYKDSCRLMCFNRIHS